MISCLYHLLNSLILWWSAISIILHCFLGIRMMCNCIKISFGHLWSVAHVNVHISLYGHHIHRLDCLKLLVVHILNTSHFILFINSMMLHSAFFTMLNWLIIRISRYLGSHLKVEFLLVCDGNHFSIGDVSAVHKYLILLILPMLHGSAHRVVTASNVRLTLPWHFSLDVLRVLVELDARLTLTDNPLQRMI